MWCLHPQAQKVQTLKMEAVRFFKTPGTTCTEKYFHVRKVLASSYGREQNTRGQTNILHVGLLCRDVTAQWCGTGAVRSLSHAAISIFVHDLQGTQMKTEVL